jgi:hypothetical protein
MSKTGLNTVIGIIGSVLPLVALSLPWWYLSISVLTYTFKVSLYAYGLSQTGNIPGLTPITLPTELQIVFNILTIVLLLATVLGLLGCFWRRGFLIGGGILALSPPLLLAVGLPLVASEIAGVKGIGLSGSLTVPIEAGVSATITWGPELGWYVSIIAAILMFAGFFIIKMGKK